MFNMVLKNVDLEYATRHDHLKDQLHSVGLADGAAYKPSMLLRLRGENRHDPQDSGNFYNGINLQVYLGDYDPALFEPLPRYVKERSPLPGYCFLHAPLNTTDPNFGPYAVAFVALERPTIFSLWQQVRTRLPSDISFGFSPGDYVPDNQGEQCCFGPFQHLKLSDKCTTKS